MLCLMLRAVMRCEFLGIAVALIALAAATRPAYAEDPPATLATLLDRAQIEDILVDYYRDLGADERGFGSYYLEDGVLDVNGIVARGRSAIAELYRKTAQGTPRRPGTFHMVLSNPRIIVNADTATADVLWTGINSASPKATPRFVEQGREHDELVKRGGRWYFKHRIITSDGGLPQMFEKTYQTR